MSREQANREMYECKRDVMMLPRTPPSPTPAQPSGRYSVSLDSEARLDTLNRDQMFRECMESKGFRWVVRWGDHEGRTEPCRTPTPGMALVWR